MEGGVTSKGITGARLQGDYDSVFVCGYVLCAFMGVCKCAQVHRQYPHDAA